MLQHISIGTFIEVIAFGTAVYYLAVIVRYYQKDIIQWLRKKSRKEAVNDEGDQQFSIKDKV